MTSDTLKVNVFGDGRGETIFLEFPNNKVGLIDCANDHFIEWFKKYSRKNNLQAIDFVIWTHPHRDHTSRFPAFFKLCQEKNIVIKNFMRFGVRYFQKISEIIEGEHEKENSPETLQQMKDLADINEAVYAGKITPSCLKNTIDLVKELKEKKFIEDISNNLQYGLTLCSDFCEDTELLCIAPTEEDINRYLEKANAWKRKELNPSYFSLSSGIHNIISVAVSIKFGEATIILGGDVEKRAWQNILSKNQHRSRVERNLNLLKVPHHGAESAYLKEAWDTWGNEFYSVIAPLQQHSLPENDHILDIAKHHSPKIFILKDKNLYTLLDYLTRQALECECKSINIDASHHICFEVHKNAHINNCWH